MPGRVPELFARPPSPALSGPESASLQVRTGCLWGCTPRVPDVAKVEGKEFGYRLSAATAPPRNCGVHQSAGSQGGAFIALWEFGDPAHSPHLLRLRWGRGRSGWLPGQEVA